ncbi:TlpA family protein disulfide reductase [Hippea alviniae]|uniref:TlpA family protein disulfide reductase n=1 Tax=Hippea alviniae TaxID=1279027 RepID=UPI0003B38F15|nr:TlpA disulfide reductase family protein [Hippea alviniae]
MKKTLIILLAFFILSPVAFAKISIRLDAPYFDNDTTTNVANYIGKRPVVLVFFYPDCTPCEHEAKEINKLYKQYKDKVFILGISLSRDRYDIGDFIKDLNVIYPIWRIHSKSDLRSIGGILATPTIVILDKKGKIVKKFIGKRPIITIEETLKQLIKEEQCTK